jgi:hypothetical protein
MPPRPRPDLLKVSLLEVQPSVGADVKSIRAVVVSASERAVVVEHDPGTVPGGKKGKPWRLTLDRTTGMPRTPQGAWRLAPADLPTLRTLP